MNERLQHYLNKQNYFGILVYGAHLDSQYEIFSNTLLVPMKHLYHNNFIDYIKDFHSIFNYKFSPTNINTYNKDFEKNIPVAYIIFATDFSTENVKLFDERSKQYIEKAKSFLSLLSGQTPTEFFKMVKLNGKFYSKTEPVQFNELTRLWFSSDEKTNFIKSSERIIENQNFALSLFCDANKEGNQIYKIARYFMVLESIVGSTQQSRNAIKAFFKENQMSVDINWFNGSRQLKFDAIEFAGLLRAKLFHGVIIKYKYFKKLVSEDEYMFIQEQPEHLAKHLRDMCEDAFKIKQKG
ncbi:MAG: hypothetical protein WBG43_01400 [Marinifilaceae bacterium]